VSYRIQSMNDRENVPTLRLATAEDAALLAELGHRTFLDAFRESVAREDMEMYLSEAFTESKMAEELSDPAALFILAFLDEASVGYAKLHFGPAHASVTGEAPVKLWRMYSDARWYGRGIGGALMEEAVRLTGERGGRTLWLTVNIHNARAIAFYRKWGFEVVGTATFALGHALHTDHVMARPVPAAPSV